MNVEDPVKPGLDGQAVWRTISRHRILVSVVFLLFSGIVSFNALTKPTVYKSSAVLYFDMSSNSPMLELLGKQAALQTIDLSFYDVIMTTNLFNDTFRKELKAALSSARSQEYIESVLPTITSSSITLSPNKENPQFFEISAVSSDTFLVRKLVEVATELLRNRAQEIDLEGLQKGMQFIEEQIEITKSNLEKTELSLQALKKKVDMTSAESEPLSRVILMGDRLAEIETQIQIRNSNSLALGGQLDSLQRKLTGNVKDVGQSESRQEIALKSKIEELQTKRVALYEKFGPEAKSSPEVLRLDNELIQLRNEYYNVLASANVGTDRAYTGDLNELWKQVFSKKNDEDLELLLLKGQARLYRGLISNFEKRNPNLLEDAIDITRLNRSKQVYEETLNSLIKQRETFSIQYYGTTSKLKLIDPAKTPAPIYNRVFTTIFIGTILGLFIGIGVAFIIDYMDTTIKTPEAVLAVTTIPIVGKIPRIEIDEPDVKNQDGLSLKRLWINSPKIPVQEDKNIMRKKAMISQFNTRSYISERYRGLRTNIQFANIDTPLRSILIGSAGPGEGKTTTAVNLAISFADMGQKVCLVDSDLRKPKHHVLFEVSDSPGLADVVLNNSPVDNALQESSIKNLHLLTVGSGATFHSEIFSSMRMNSLMNELEKRFDIVIYDAPPILLLTDSIILSSRVDGVLLVIKYGLTQKSNLTNAIHALRNVRSNVIGIVMNQFGGDHENYYSYAYDSYYKHPSEKSEILGPEVEL